MVLDVCLVSIYNIGVDGGLNYLSVAGTRGIQEMYLSLNVAVPAVSRAKFGALIQRASVQCYGDIFQRIEHEDDANYAQFRKMTRSICELASNRPH